MVSHIDFFRCSSIFFLPFAEHENGSMMGVVYFEWNIEYIMNSLSLPRLRTGLPWFAGGSLGQ